MLKNQCWGRESNSQPLGPTSLMLQPLGLTRHRSPSSLWKYILSIGHVQTEPCPSHTTDQPISTSTTTTTYVPTHNHDPHPRPWCNDDNDDTTTPTTTTTTPMPMTTPTPMSTSTPTSPPTTMTTMTTMPSRVMTRATVSPSPLFLLFFCSFILTTSAAVIRLQAHRWLNHL